VKGMLGLVLHCLILPKEFHGVPPVSSTAYHPL